MRWCSYIPDTDIFNMYEIFSKIELLVLQDLSVSLRIGKTNAFVIQYIKI